MNRIAVLATVLIPLFCAADHALAGDDSPPKGKTRTVRPDAIQDATVGGNSESLDADSGREQRRGLRLANYLSGKKFIGRFTVDGDDSKLPKAETYEIRHCEKLPQPNQYRLTARIKYGQVDQEIPLELTIVFAGNTPVITLDNLWIPGMGTFDARVLIRRDRYAGTWKHGDKGGHLFGQIALIQPRPSDQRPPGK